MNYLVTVTFVIKGGDSEAYETVYASFEKFGLRRTINGTGEKSAKLPTTMTAGTFRGASGIKLRDDIAGRCHNVFSANSLHGELFVCVGGEWGWSYYTA
jgi:hypothetical protein